MPDCLFSIYYENGKECNRQYKCDGCEVHKSIKTLVGAVMEQKAKNKEVANGQANKFNFPCPCAAKEAGSCGKGCSLYPPAAEL